MTVTIDAFFQNRLWRDVRGQDQDTNSLSARVNEDGLIIAAPRQVRPRFPVVGLLAILALAVMFKAYIYAALGAEDYAARVVMLSTGTISEQMGSYVMFADPITVRVGDVLREIFF